MGDEYDESFVERAMTVEQLHEITARLVKEGNGKASVMFDTECRTYDYHMARVGIAVYKTLPIPHLALHESLDSNEEERPI